MTAVSPATQLGLWRGRETVLVVEDDDRVRDVIRTALELSGYMVLDAVQGVDAIRVSAGYSGPIQLVIADVVMPELGGRALIDRLANDRPGMRVLYISGHPDEVIVAHGVLGAGAALLRKPFTPLELLRRAREVLDSPPS